MTMLRLSGIGKPYDPASGVAHDCAAVRSDTAGAHLIVADGFHRLCAVMHTDQDGKVACKIA